MNKQAAKLAKTTALLNSTSIQLRISGLAVGTLWSTITQGLDYRLNGDDSAAMRGEWSILNNDKSIRPAFMEISWWGWKKRGPFPVRVSDSSMEDDPTFEYLKDGKWITIEIQNYEDGDGEYDNRGFHEY